jgi:hypothetical protein
MIEGSQPFHGGAQAHTAPLEILRWLSNVDKHQAVHVLGRTAVDFGPALVEAAFPVEVVEEWRLDGPAADGAVVARLKLRRPSGDNLELQVRPTFAHIASLRISETPEEYRDLPSLMTVLSERVLWTLAAFGGVLGVDPPMSLELGDEHDAYAADRGGNLLVIGDAETRRVVRIETPEPNG